MLLWIVIFILALLALIKGADWFTEGAEGAGLKLGMSPFVVGVTIVSIGTSLPELASSIAAVFQNSAEVVVGNVVGSNIANILLVLGLGAIVGKKLLIEEELRSDITFLVLITIVFIAFGADRSIDWWEAIALMILFIGYIWFSLKKPTAESGVDVPEKIFWPLTLGLVLVIIGANYLIQSVIVLSNALGISAAVIGASVVALGTSVPEAVVTIVALLKGKKEVAIGNIIGSNIFNLLFIPGVAGLLAPLPLENPIPLLGLPVLLASTLLFAYVIRDRKISWKEGSVLLTFYCVYIFALFL